MSVNAASRTLANRLYCPILFRFAAHLEQMNWSDFTSDPVDTVAALRNAQAASGADLVINWFDTWAECEALGAAVMRDLAGNALSYTPPLQSVIDGLTPHKSKLLSGLKEIAARLHADRRPGMLLGGFLTGPHTLVNRLIGVSQVTPVRGDNSAVAERPAAVQLAVQWAIELIRGYGEIGLDLSIIAEEEPGAGVFYCEQAKTLQPIINLSRYYRHPLIVLNRARLENESSYMTLGCAPHSGAINIIPEDLFNVPGDGWRERLKMHERTQARGTLMFSAWEVAINAEPERVREIGAVIKNGVG
jgi:hypothetical protein